MNHSFSHRAAGSLVACLLSTLTFACSAPSNADVDGDVDESASSSLELGPSHLRFQDYCENATSLPASTKATVDALLAKVQTEDCAVAQTKLEGMTTLEFFSSGPRVGDLAPLATLRQLTSLTLAEQKLEDLRPLARLVNLETLRIYANDATTTTPWGACPILFPDTDKWGPHARIDIRPLAHLRRLTRLGLRTGIVRDLRPLGRLDKIRSLDLDCLDFGGNLAPLANMPELAYLDLSRGSVRDLSPIPSFAASGSGFHILLGGSPIESLRPLALLSALQLESAELERLPIARDEEHCPTTIPGMRRDIKVACLNRNGATPATAASWLSAILEHPVTEDNARTMKQLDLSGRSLDVIDTPFLQGLPALEMLNLSHTTSPPSTSRYPFASLVLRNLSAGQPLPKVRELRLRGTFIRSLPDDNALDFIERVDLRDNRLTNVSGCSFLFPHAQELLLEGNPIELPPLPWTPRNARRCARSVRCRRGNGECLRRSLRPRRSAFVR
ncbi:hypothetical protein LZC95_00945 [Pendulispora brunnea]|uniref:Leucine-rich repeat domain-containing protein n=1 Tax=Pendulispora brunnea TaxID=2905690 RepID=A0ABZ2KD43_9BACT